MSKMQEEGSPENVYYMELSHSPRLFLDGRYKVSAKSPNISVFCVIHHFRLHQRAVSFFLRKRNNPTRATAVDLQITVAIRAQY